MKKGIKKILLTLSLIGLSISAKASDAVSPVFLELDKGEIMGYLDENVYHFMGIPYGEADRFEQPVEVNNWDGILKCLYPGEVSPQKLFLEHSSVSAQEFATPAFKDIVANEDTCLNLNVWTSSIDPNEKRPVVVFMHGGGLKDGGATELASYDGQYFAGYTNCVFVSVNSRLNYLGFLDVSAYGDERYAYSGNCGLSDLLLSLEWIQNNISRFGGDPGNVTLVGQSGGTKKVTSLACMPAAEGLFQKVFIMSGTYETTTKEKKVEETAALVEYLGLQDDEDVIGALKELSYEELYNACMETNVSVTAEIDGDYFPSPWYDTDSGTMNEFAAERSYMVSTTMAEHLDYNTALVIGRDYITDENLRMWKYWINDEEEYDLVKSVLGDKTDDAIAAFREAYPYHTDNYDVLSATPERKTRALVECEICAESNVPVYNAVVAYELPWFGGSAMQHSGDIAFWFHSLKNQEYQIRGDEENAYKVADEMAAALAAFALTGNPSTDQLTWTPYTSDNHNTMVFDVESYEKEDFDAELLQILFEE